MRITDGQTAAAYQTMANAIQQVMPDAAPPQETEADSGPDRKASSILADAANGRRLTRKELGYIARNRPDQFSVLAKTSAERRSFERRIRKAKSKQEVRWAHASAVAHAGREATTAGEGFTRVNQLTDARNEYMKDPEYWRKPDQTPVGRKKRKVSENAVKVHREDLRPSPKSCEESHRFKKAGGK